MNASSNVSNVEIANRLVGSEMCIRDRNKAAVEAILLAISTLLTFELAFINS